MSNKDSKKRLSVCFTALLVGGLWLSNLIFAQEDNPPMEKTIDGKKYALAFNDEFNGSEIDFNKWKYRILGVNPDRFMVLTKDAAKLDGQGNLVLSMYTQPRSALPTDIEPKFAPAKWIPYTSMLRTQQEFTYGYHEVRLLMPIVKGAGMSVWLQSNGQTRKPASPNAKDGAEIDIIEQTFFDKRGEPIDFKHSTIHWGGYADTHQWISINVASKDKMKVLTEEQKKQQDEELNLKNQEKDKLIHERRTHYSDNLNFRDGQFHTVALLWTPEYYKFYYDGELIGTMEKGVSETPGYMILWPRLFTFRELAGNSEDGLGDLANTQANFLVDYYRVYQPQ